MKDETEKCWLDFNEEEYLVCTYNHTLGALCLGNKCQYCNELECVCYSDTPTKTEVQIADGYVKINDVIYKESDGDWKIFTKTDKQ